MLPLKKFSEKNRMHTSNVISYALFLMLMYISIGSAATTITGSVSIDGNGANWTADNFAWFYHDTDHPSGTESLRFEDLYSTFPPISDGQRVIEEGELIYSTSPRPQLFKVCEAFPDVYVGEYDHRTYEIIGWMGKKYVAVNRRADTLTKLIYEMDANDSKTLYVGESWNLGGGYSLVPIAIDLDGGKVILTLYKNGVKLESQVVNGYVGASEQSRTFIYTEDITIEKKSGFKSFYSDVPVFVAYVDEINREGNYIRLKYVYLISTEDIISIENGDVFGIFESSGTSASSVRLVNKDNIIILTKNSVINLMDDLKLKVEDDSLADDDNCDGNPDDLRFYPFVGAVPTTPLNIPPSVSITTPSEKQSKNIAINYNLADTESNICALLSVQYSQDYYNWHDATKGSGGDSTTGLTSSPCGITHTYVWASGTDLPDTDESTVYFRIKPNDGLVNGSYGVSGAFHVDNVPPSITNHTPNGTNIPLDTTITVTFSEAMNKTSIQSAFSISPSVSGAFSWYGNKMTFIPSSNIASNITYTVTIGTGAKDLADNNLQSSYNWQFTTLKDKTSPTLTIIRPLNNSITIIRVITVSGTASDNESGIAKVTVNGELASGTSEWSKEVALSKGSNTITVIATDNAGNNISNTIIVTYNAVPNDFSGNGKVDIDDATIVSYMVIGKVPSDLSADYNQNGRVDIGDAAKIAFYVAGKISEL
ncbi:MAG: S-layer protein domain-containing protein [Methanosarcinales archaeon]